MCCRGKNASLAVLVLFWPWSWTPNLSFDIANTSTILVLWQKSCKTSRPRPILFITIKNEKCSIYVIVYYE